MKIPAKFLMVPVQSNPMVGRMGHYDGAGLDLMSVLEARRGHGPGTGCSSSDMDRGERYSRGRRPLPAEQGRGAEQAWQITTAMPSEFWIIRAY